MQVVIALIATPEGFPLAYEVLPGNTTDKTTLREFLRKIETQYGKAQRIWIMDRGIPTEEVLEQMRLADPPVYYLVGTPKGRLSKLERALLALSWAAVRPGVDVKLLPHDQELYVFAQSRDRIHKERAMRTRQLKRLVKRLKQLQTMKLKRTQLLLKLGEAKARYRAAWRLIEITMAEAAAAAAPATGGLARRHPKQRRVARTRRLKQASPISLSASIARSCAKCVGARVAICCARILCGRDPAQLWQFYIQLTEIEAAFKNLKDDLQLRPIYHQLERRIEAHIFVAFIAYCLHVTLRARLTPLAAGLTPRSVLDKFAAMQMLDVHFPTTDGRTLILSRYTEPDVDQRILLDQLNIALPPQPPPRIGTSGQLMARASAANVVETF